MYIVPLELLTNLKCRAQNERVWGDMLADIAVLLFLLLFMISIPYKVCVLLNK